LIKKASLTTLAVTTLESPIDGGVVVTPEAIAVDANYVYWGNFGNPAGTSTIFRAKKDGTSPYVLASGLNGVTGISLDATRIYFTTSVNNAVLSVPLGGGMATTISATESGATAIVNDATAVYWLTSSTVRKMTKVGGAITTLSSCNGLAAKSPACGRFGYLAVDATDVYWTDEGTQYGGGAVYTTPKN
jgi:hypothetical protein